MARTSFFDAMVIVVVFVTIPEMISGVKIMVKPQSEPVWYVEGDPLVLTCIIEGEIKGVPQWLKNAVPVDPQFITTSKDSTSSLPKTILTMRKDEAVQEDDGIYNCMVDGSDVGKRLDMITVTARDVNLTLGFQTTLTCDIEPFYEKTSITWLKGKTPLSKIPEVEGRLTLGQYNTTAIIMNSKVSDAGVYTCIIKFNPDTEMEQTFSKSPGIRGKPRVLSSSLEELTTITNKSIIMTCPVVAYPEPEVFWLRGNDVIEPSERYILSPFKGVPDTQLEIKNPTDKDFVSYVCVMENSVGKTEFNINLKSSNNSARKNSIPGILTSVFGIFLVAYMISL